MHSPGSQHCQRCFVSLMRRVPLGSKFFPFLVDPFFRKDFVLRKQTGSHKNVTLVKMVVNLPRVSGCLKEIRG